MANRPETSATPISAAIVSDLFSTLIFMVANTENQELGSRALFGFGAVFSMLEIYTHHINSWNTSYLYVTFRYATNSNILFLNISFNNYKLES